MYVQNLLLLDNILSSLSNRCRGLSIFSFKEPPTSSLIYSLNHFQGVWIWGTFSALASIKRLEDGHFSLYVGFFFIYSVAAASLLILIKKFPISYIIYKIAGLHFPSDWVLKKVSISCGILLVLVRAFSVF